jgi:archaellum component FlaG (FlaF/FlaG flagellin family)
MLVFKTYVVYLAAFVYFVLNTGSGKQHFMNDLHRVIIRGNCQYAMLDSASKLKV